MGVTTAVRCVFSAAHADPLTGAQHGHDYEVIATFPGDELRRFEVLQERLRGILRAFDHRVLADDLWSAESLAKALGSVLGDAIQVQVNRPWLGHFATWTP